MGVTFRSTKIRRVMTVWEQHVVLVSCWNYMTPNISGSNDARSTTKG